MVRRPRLRLPASKKLTFLYVPDDASVRQFVIPKAFLYVLAGGACMMLLLMGIFGARYVRAAADGRVALGLRGENVQLHERLGELRRQVATLQGEMRVTQQMERQLRTMASLPEIHPDILEAGVGGPEPEMPADAALRPQTRRDVESAGQVLGQLLRQAELQRQSYAEILAALENKRNVWDHTPSVRPVSRGMLTSHYGRRMDPFTGQRAMHRGADFTAMSGTPIRATAAGVVTMASRWGGFGLMVEVDHGGGLRTRYAHCSRVHVKPGDRVTRGQTIARVGSTGRSSGSHVHYEVIRDGMHLDPIQFVLPADVIVD